MSILDNLQRLLTRLGSGNVQLNPPLEAKDEKAWVDQLTSIEAKLKIPSQLLELLRIGDGQTGMPIFSYFTFSDTQHLLTRFQWFHDRHPLHLPFADGEAEDYLMIDCSDSASNGHISNWYIESREMVCIAHSIDDLIQRSIAGVEKLGEPNINILSPIYAFEFTAVDQKDQP